MNRTELKTKQNIVLENRKTETEKLKNTKQHEPLKKKKGRRRECS